MSIEIPPAEVHALAGRLHRAAADAEQIAPRLDRAGDVGDILQPGVAAFLDGQRAVTRALAGELAWLGATLAAVADSWTAMDRQLLATRGRSDSA